MTLDLQDRQDKEIFQELVKVADVVISNSRPGVLKRLGFDYEILKGLNPGIILVSMSAFGQTGPESDYVGYGGTIEALGGIQSLTAYEPEGKPKRIKEMDVTNGIMGACAVLTALIDRQITGQGKWIDLSQTEAATHGLIGEHLMEYAINGNSSLPVGNRDATDAIQGCYRCKGEDKWVVMSISSESEWSAFCELTGHPEWTEDPRFANQEERRKNHDEIDKLIEKWTGQYTHIEAMHLLQSAGLAGGAVLNVADICQDPHLQQREYFQKPKSGGEVPLAGFPFQLSKGGGSLDKPAPDLGADNRDVICDLLGRPESEVKPISSTEIGTGYDIA